MKKKTRRPSANASQKSTTKAAPKAAAQGASVGKLSVRLLDDNVLVRPLSPEEMGTKTAHGIIIPDTVEQDRPEQGLVVAVGEGRLENGKRIPLSVKVGDRVVFSKYGPDEVKIDGEEYLLLKADSVRMVLL